MIQSFFAEPNLGTRGIEPGVSQPLFTRGAKPDMPAEYIEAQAAIARGEMPDLQQLMGVMMGSMDSIARNINTGITGFPVRENLEAEAKILFPVETPLRNRIPRVPGAGTAAAWKQLTALGGGWGSGVDQPGGGTASQVFFAETGAPAELTSTYANKSASYKLMGTLGSVTGFAMATGANFQNQYATEKRNLLFNTMLNEENAIINGSATSTAAPWGDGTNALGFNGLVNLITTANGTPSAQVQTGVGALSFAFLDTMLRNMWIQGARSPWILMNSAQLASLRNLVSAASTAPYRVVAGVGNEVSAGLFVNTYVHPTTGEMVPIIVSRFVPAGTVIFGADQLPDGSPALQMDVLPQVQLPELAPNDFIQGYVAQELAPTKAAPQVFPFLISCYLVLKMKGATVFGIGSGVS